MRCKSFVLYSLSLLLVWTVAKTQTHDYDSTLLLKNCITLDAKESVDEERNDLIYNWKFGDGEEGIGQVVDHCYANLGTYTIELSVIDTTISSLFQEEWFYDVTIEKAYSITMNIRKESDLSIVCEPILSTSEKPELVAYFWDFGDGKYDVGDKVIHRYDTTGTFSIRLLAKVTAEDEVIKLSTTKSIKIN
jgi:hypothetical protein